MKYYLFAIILFAILLVSGCSGPATDDETTKYSDSSISFAHPSWPDVKGGDAQTFMLKSDNKCVFSAAKYPVPIPLMKTELEKSLNAVFDGDYADYTLNGMEAKTRLVYCDYNTYAISTACPADPDVSLLSDFTCNRKVKAVPKLALIPIPKNDDSSLIIPAIRESRDNGADVLSWYIAWKNIDGNQKLADQLMIPLSYEGRTAILIPIIYTNQLGKFPKGYSHFTDRNFKEDFAKFSKDFINSYHPEYYFIGGEVDIYLDMHRDEINDYKEFFSYVKEEIKKAHPETKVGIVFAYHAAKAGNALDIIKTLAPDCDIVGYTVHAYEDDFDYSDESRELQYLNEAARLIPNKPYAILEAGWSSSPLLGSSEAKQSKAADDFFSFLESSDAEFVLWFGLHEWSDCTKYADEFIMGAKVSDEYMSRFKEFMCSLGLKRADGTPKEVWKKWQEYVAEK